MPVKNKTWSTVGSQRDINKICCLSIKDYSHLFLRNKQECVGTEHILPIIKLYIFI